jgi:hypothetical protein
MKQFKIPLNTLNIIGFSLFVMLLASCDLKEKINNALTFQYNEEITFSIPASSIVDLPINIGTPDIKSSGQQAFENNNTSISLVEEVYLSELTLNITDPSDRTFSFLKSIKIYIRTNDNNEILLAERLEIPDNISATLVLETSGENLKAYVKEEAYSIRYEVVTRETTNSKTTLISNMTFTVNAATI